jgi:hypothetical protein
MEMAIKLRNLNFSPQDMKYLLDDLVETSGVLETCERVTKYEKKHFLEVDTKARNLLKSPILEV